MNDTIISACRQHWQNLAPHVKDRAIAKHLAALLEVAERLYRECNKLEMEARVLRTDMHELGQWADETVENCSVSRPRPVSCVLNTESSNRLSDE